jgi:hypothetical protein
LSSLRNEARTAVAAPVAAVAPAAASAVLGITAVTNRAMNAMPVRNFRTLPMSRFHTFVVDRCMVPVFLRPRVTGENGAGWVAFFRDLAARGCREDARAP